MLLFIGRDNIIPLFKKENKMKFSVKMMGCTLIFAFFMLTVLTVGEGHGAFIGGGRVQNLISAKGNTVGGTYGSGNGQIPLTNEYTITAEITENTLGGPPEITFSNFYMDLGSTTLNSTGQYYEIGSLSKSHVISTTLNIDSFTFTIGSHGPYPLTHRGGTLFDHPIIRYGFAAWSPDDITVNDLVTANISGSYTISGENETVTRSFNYSIDTLYDYSLQSKYDVANFPDSVDLVSLWNGINFDPLNIFTENIDGCELSFSVFGTVGAYIRDGDEPFRDEPLTLTANSQVTIPSSFILLGSSLLGLVGIKSRKKKS